MMTSELRHKITEFLDHGRKDSDKFCFKIDGFKYQIEYRLRTMSDIDNSLRKIIDIHLPGGNTLPQYSMPISGGNFRGIIERISLYHNILLALREYPRYVAERMLEAVYGTDDKTTRGDDD